MNISLNFGLNEKGTVIKETGFYAEFNGKELELSMYYDYSDKPLVLKAPCKAGDKISVRIFDALTELCVNGILFDEEWQYGKPVYNIETLKKYCFIADAEELKFEEKTFTNAQGWKPEKNVFVGDCIPFSDGKTFHIFYLKDRHHHTSKWGKGAHQWAHISTKDFKTWIEHPLAVKIDEQNEGSVCTGSVYLKDGIYYAFYSVRQMDKKPSPICRAISYDGINFKKDDKFKIGLSEKYRQDNIRDPKVWLDENGLYRMIVTTSLKTEDGNWQGCLAQLTSEDFCVWKEAEPFYMVEKYSYDFPSPWEIEPECPDYFKYGDYYYLCSRSEYSFSRNPFGPFEKPEKISQCGCVPKMALWNGEMIFVGFIWSENGYAGTLKITKALQEKDGSLRFEDLSC